MITYEQWMKDTAAFGRARSTELKALDQALKTYEDAQKNSSGSILHERRAVQQALTAWKAAQTAKGQQWQSSVRNKLKTVEKLDADLGHIIVGAGGLNSRGDTMMDPKEVIARKAVADAIKGNTRTMFAGAKLTVKNTKALADLNDVRSTLGEFKNAAKDIKDAVQGVAQPDLPQKVKELLVSLFGNAPVHEVQSALGPVFGDFVTSVTPFIGTIKSGGQALFKWGQAANGLYQRKKMNEGANSFAPGDPAAAFEAIITIQTREIKAYASTASIYTVSAAAKGAFTALDFGGVSGPVLGAAETLALTVQKIYLFARDWNEMKEANELLAKGQYDLGLFKACPLLGCYLIANSTTSSVINIAVGDYGKTGWNLDVEAMVIKAQPAFEKARSVIRESRYEIASMRGMKGTVVDRTAKTLGLPTGKLDGAIEDITNKINRIGS